MTTEQILERIKQQRGETALGDSRQLMGIFADYSRGQLKPHQNQLRIFLECRGNTRILNLRDVPQQKQQVEWNRLIQEMVNDYGMQNEVAMEISGAFWRVVIGTEPPVLEDAPSSKPEHSISARAKAAVQAMISDTQQRHSKNASGTAGSNTAQKKGAQRFSRFIRRIKEMFIWERVVFLLGIFSVVTIFPSTIAPIIAEIPTICRGFFGANHNYDMGDCIEILLICGVFMPILLVPWRMVQLWKHGPFHVVRKFKYEKHAYAMPTIHFLFLIFLCVLVVVDGIDGFPMLSEPFAPILLLGWMATFAFHMLWHIIYWDIEFTRKT